MSSGSSGCSSAIASAPGVGRGPSGTSAGSSNGGSSSMQTAGAFRRRKRRNQVRRRPMQERLERGAHALEAAAAVGEDVEADRQLRELRARREACFGSAANASCLERRDNLERVAVAGARLLLHLSNVAFVGGRRRRWDDPCLAGPLTPRW